MTAVAPAPDRSPTRSPITPPAGASRGTGRYLAAQVAGAFGQSAGVSAGLLAEHMSGSEALAMVPIGALALGGAAAGPLLTAVMARRGRSAGLLVGYAAAVGGAVVSMLAAAAGSLGLLVVATAVFGAGNSAVMLTRYVLADAVSADRRGQAISRSLLATTAGSIVGPNLLGPTAPLGAWLGLPDPAGLYLMAVVAFGLAAVWLRPGASRRGADTAVVEDTAVAADAAMVAEAASAPALAPAAAAVAAGGRGRGDGARLALGILAVANATMVSVMSLAAVHLHDHGHDLGTIGLVVSLHVAGMFVGSPVVGQLCDRVGPVRVASAGAALLAAVGVAGAVLADSGVVATSVVLLVLGVAWNVQVVAGSVLLTAGLPLVRRPAAEGRGELVMGLAAGTGTLLGASPLAALGGFRLVAGVVAVVGAALAGRLRVALRSAS